ncbi:MAG: low molecular weight phosphotyrosine protein phosphatase [Bacteroidetes bacterium]|nr:low molecular weight phosphotyrosine protein phosphatase [Bacteroidota bacterium]
MKVLMVCLGNICRSPLAEGILRHKVEERGLDWQIDSAGTGSWHVGELPDPRSVAVAKKYGLDITDQRARQFQSSDLESFDLVYAMDASNYQNILRLASSENQKEKVRLILEEVEPGSGRQVPDPYWNSDGFEKVYHMLDEACEQIIASNLELKS